MYMHPLKYENGDKYFLRISVIRSYGYGTKRFFNWLSALFSNIRVQGENKGKDNQDGNSQDNNPQNGSGNEKKDKNVKKNPNSLKAGSIFKPKKNLEGPTPEKTGK